MLRALRRAAHSLRNDARRLRREAFRAVDTARRYVRPESTANRIRLLLLRWGRRQRGPTSVAGASRRGRPQAKRARIPEVPRRAGGVRAQEVCLADLRTVAAAPSHESAAGALRLLRGQGR